MTASPPNISVPPARERPAASAAAVDTLPTMRASCSATDAGDLPDGDTAHCNACRDVDDFMLDGRHCRIVCVDDLVPSHRHVTGATRARQMYRPDEVAHFQFGTHRYALVAEGEPIDAQPGERRIGDICALLTNRELQIVQLICNGLLTKQVSDRLRISEFTVRSYLKTIYCKLGVRSRGAMVYAYAQSFARFAKSSTTLAEGP